MADTDRDPFDIALGRKLKAQRALKGLRLVDAGAQVGLSFSALSAYETGKRTPGTAILRRLAGLYGLEVGDLMPSVDEVVNVQTGQVEAHAS